MVTIQDLRITGGTGVSGRGVYINDGDVTLRRVAVTGNRVTSNGNSFGGGVLVFGGEVDIVDSLVADNRIMATGGQAVGGGVYGQPNTLINATNSTFAANRADCTDLCGVSFGGGISMHDGLAHERHPGGQRNVRDLGRDRRQPRRVPERRPGDQELDRDQRPRVPPGPRTARSPRGP